MTQIAGGLGGAVGIAKETTYGTFVSPTRFIEVRSAKLQERMHLYQGTGLAYNRSIDLGTRRGKLWADGGGTVELEFLNSGMALLLANALGSAATLTQNGTTTAYTLTCNYGVPDTQNFFSLQSLIPNTSGTITPENYHGCKITKATWNIDLQNPLMWSLDVDAQSKEETTTAVVPSYTTATRNFTPNNMTFSAGAFGSETSIDGVKRFTLSIERTLKLDRIYVGQTAKAEPTTSGITKITGSMDVDLTANNKSVLWDIYHSQAAVPSIKAVFTGNAIGSSGYNDSFTLNATNVFIDTGGTPELDGPDIVSTTLNWTGLIDSANDAALIATLVTSDSTF